MQKQNNQLLILTLGGTIDKSYGAGAGVRDLSFSVQEPAVTDILREVSASLDYTTVRLMSKDSLDMDENDRKTIAAMCKAMPQNHILITHGTDTMIQTAQVIARLNLRKTVVLTGASQPAIMRGSDAMFNVGFALNAALLAKPGVYVAMNACLQPWNKVKKNPQTGIFEPT